MPCARQEGGMRRKRRQEAGMRRDAVCKAGGRNEEEEEGEEQRGPGTKKDHPPQLKHFVA